MSTTALDKYIEQVKRLNAPLLAISDREEDLIREAWNAGQRNPEPHQGYRNYETFALGVLLEHDADLQKLWLAAARAESTFKDPDIRLADRLKEWFDLRGDYLTSPHIEWFRAGYEAVDWLELARLLLDKLEGKNQ